MVLEGPSRPDTVLGALERWARVQPERAACRERGGGARSYFALARRVAGVAAQLKAAGLQGERVLVLHPPGTGFVEALLGCMAGGVVPVPAWPWGTRARGESAEGRLRGLITDARPQAALTTEAERLHLDQHFLKGAGLRWIATDRAEVGAPGVWGVDPDDVALLHYPDSARGRPRGVVLSHRNLATHAWALGRRLGVTSADRLVHCLPMHHGAGLLVAVLAAIQWGVSTVSISPDEFARAPRVWVESISDVRATLACAPDVAYDLCARAASAPGCSLLDLSRWRVACCSGLVRADTLERFARAFSVHGFRERAFHPVHERAEATFGVSARSGVGRIPDPEGGLPRVGLGSALPGHELRIVDPDSAREVPAGELGEVWLRGPSVARGYWGRPEETEATFGVELGGARYLRTGDVGRVLDGELVVTGRLGGEALVEGREVVLSDVEATARAAHDAVRAGSCVAFVAEGLGGEVVLVAELGGEGSEDVAVAATLGRAVREEHALALGQVVVVPRGTLARTAAGDPCREAAARRHAEGRWPRPPEGSRAPSDPVVAALVDELSAALGRGVGRDLQRPLAELGLDSLSAIDVLSRLRTRFDTTFRADAVTPSATLGDLALALTRPGAREWTRPKEGPVPLTPVVHELLAPGARARSLGAILYLRVPAAVGWDAAEEALRAVAGRHDVFGVRLSDRGGWRGRYVADDARVRCSRRDARGAAARSLSSEVHRTLFEGVDVEQGPLVHTVALDRGRGEAGTWVVGLHHLACDGLSLPLVLADVERALRGEVLGPSPSWVAWAEHLQRRAAEPARANEVGRWQELFAGFVPREPPALEQDVRGRDVRERELDLEVCEAVRARFPSARARHDAALAASARAWCEVTKATRVVVQLEGHGRSAWGAPAPLETVGWVVERHPLPVVLGSDPRGDLTRVQQAQAQLPEAGMSYGVTRYASPDPELRAALGALPKAELEFVYRGRIDQTQRASARDTLRLLGAREATAGRKAPPGTVVYVGERGRRLWWRAVVPEGPRGEALEAELERRLGRLAEL